MFARQERQRLQPLPAGEWKTETYAVRKVGKTCHVVFGKNYYSVPPTSKASPPARSSTSTMPLEAPAAKEAAQLWLDDDAGRVVDLLA